jgi:Fic family protein
MEKVPAINQEMLIKAFELYSNEEIKKAAEKINDEYLYWSDAKYKPLPQNLSAEEMWAVVKLSRTLQKTLNLPKYGISVTVTNKMQEMCHNLDMNFSGSLTTESVLPTKDRERYLISSLMEEAISSSQMEGAATTRKIAKEMLRKKQSPRDRSQQMIVNNYQSIRYLIEHKDEPLNKELIMHIHEMMTTKTLKNAEDEGKFRTTNDIVVANEITNEIVHQPPTYEDIPEFIEWLCKFVNEPAQGTFIHPIIRAIIVHFMVAYMHPFVDGNGRTARALFYWYMLKQGYWLMEYLSISRIIYRSKTSYENAYLYTESDDNDMGYFIHYHLKVLLNSFKELKAYIQHKSKEQTESLKIMREENLNERQAEILALYKNKNDTVLTVKEVQSRFAVSDPTARNDLMTLVNRGYLEEIHVNKVKVKYVIKR